MNRCDKCPVRDFVHTDLYCRDCQNKPQPKQKTGRAYLFRKNAFRPIYSTEIEAPADLVYEVAAAEIMKRFRIEFIEADGKELSELVFNEFQKGA